MRKPHAPLADLLKPYWRWIAALVLLTMLSNAVSLVIPKLIAWAIDSYAVGGFRLERIATWFGVAAAGIFAVTSFLSVVQAYASEAVARDLRNRVATKISYQDSAYVQELGAARLLTNLTSDIDTIKPFVTFVITSMVSSVFVSVGACALMFSIDRKLALCVLLVLSLVGAAFVVVLRRLKRLAVRGRASIDWLNRVINESIVGSTLIRLLNSQEHEREKFLAANSAALQIGLAINRPFAVLAPAVALAAGLATLVVVAFGGSRVIAGQLSLGNVAAFNSYVVMLALPMSVLSAMTNVSAQASAAYGRIAAVLAAPVYVRYGTITGRLRGDVTVARLTLQLGPRKALDDVSFHAPASTRTAILGPTAAGKTQLLYALAGLSRPQSGEILFDGAGIDRYDMGALRRQIGLVFQDSVMFNLTMRENIAFCDTIDEASMRKALETAELADFVATLPDGLDTLVSERGTSLSGGQRQRVMLARALATEPKILLLDDFTARVDARTEQRILANVRKNYPDVTLISVTQRIAPVEDYEQIVLLMEGQVLVRGTHAELMQQSVEYVQIYHSQQSTEDYALRS